MKNKAIREYLDTVNEGALILLDNPSFDMSIIGITTQGNVVYDYTKMVYEYMNDTNSSEEEARKFIDEDTSHMLTYISSDFKPIIMYSGFSKHLLKKENTKKILNEEVSKDE